MPTPHYAADGSVRTPGTSLSKGRVYRFRPDGVTVIDPWPNPRAWTKRNGGRWLAARPCIDLSAVSPRHAPITWPGQPEQPVYEAIPKHVATAVVDAHLERLQWASLQLAARVPGGLELLQETPVLGAALAAAYCVRPTPVKRPLRSARALLRNAGGMRTWRRVAGWLGFGDSAAMVRLFRRIQVVPDRPLTLAALEGLRQSWGEPLARKRLLHAPRVDRNVLELIALARAAGAVQDLHPALVDAVFNQGESTWLPRRFDQLVRSWPELRPGRAFPVLRSAQALDALHAELSAEVHSQEAIPVEFPPPPLPSAPGIEPLTGPEALRAESKVMHNCLDLESWAQGARRCAGYAYRVSVDQQQADIWIAPAWSSPAGTFRVLEARGPANAPAPMVCMDRVRSWLHEQQRPDEEPLARLPERWRQVWTRPRRQPSSGLALFDDIPF